MGLELSATGCRLYGYAAGFIWVEAGWILGTGWRLRTAGFAGSHDVGKVGSDIDNGLLVSSWSDVGCWSFIAARCARHWLMVAGIVVNGPGMGLWNVVGWVEGLEEGLQKSVGIKLVAAG